MDQLAIGRLPAPIAYRDVRAPLNVVRAFAAVVIGTVAGIAASTGHPAAAAALLCTVVVLGDAVVRLRTFSAGPTSMIAVDATAIGVAILATGDSASLEVASFVYILTAALLLLPRLRAVGMIAYSLAYLPLILTFAPLFGTERTGVAAAVTDRLVAGVFILVTALLLLAAGRALYAAVETHRTALETERRAVAIKNEFVSMVSHELRTPLTSIAGFTEALRDGWRSLEPGEVDEFLTIMRREEEHLAELVEDILVIPRLDAGQLRLQPEPIALRAVAHDTAQAVFRGSRSEVDVAIPGNIVVAADPIRLGQILRNLLENARKYGGDQVLVEGEVRGNDYLVAVCDNGPGVGEADRQRIFEHFEQLTKGDSRSDKGIGLGLPIARRLTRAMGGDLWYEDRFPTGSRFCFTVALGSQVGRSSGAPPNPEPVHKTSPRP